jgi:wyosine [tRNA(Phe)-imidazoG37] synthetase (radical SAM superfamily)
MPDRIEVNLDVLRSELDHMLSMVVRGDIWRETPFDHTPVELRRLNDVAFSGDGEPTSFAKFEEACQLAARLLEQSGLDDVKIVVITNASLFHQSRVQSALKILDAHNGELWAKLDAGTQEYYKLVERTAVPFQQVLDNILSAGRARPIVIQSLFMNINNEPPGETEIAAYVSRLQQLKDNGCQIKLVQVYTIARTTAESYVSPLNKQQIDEITRKVGELGLNAEAYYGPE